MRDFWLSYLSSSCTAAAVALKQSFRCMGVYGNLLTNFRLETLTFSGCLWIACLCGIIMILIFLKF